LATVIGTFWYSNCKRIFPFEVSNSTKIPVSLLLAAGLTSGFAACVVVFAFGAAFFGLSVRTH